MDLNRNKKEFVKDRLKQTAARIWGHHESETEGFDPVIDLLFGACATEFERLSTEIYNSQSRILEKVAQILLPDVNLQPIPSYSIMHAKPSIPEKYTEQTDQFNVKKEITGNVRNKNEVKNIFFAPIPHFRLIDAEILMVATSQEINQMNDQFPGETIIRSSSHGIPHNNSLWLGIKLNSAISSLKEISIYFDWFNNPDKAELLRLLWIAEWFVDNKNVSLKNGYNQVIENRFYAETSDITGFQDINLKIEKRVAQIFENHFCTISEDLIPVKKNYPDEFSKYFDMDDLDTLKEELLWLKIDFPEIFPSEQLAKTFCSLNAFPVLNKRIHNSNRPYTVNKDLNIIPVISDDYFFSIRNIESSNGINYQETPFKRVSDMGSGTYTVRTDGVKRFDKRNANEFIHYLIELLREEQVAFESIGSSLIEKELNDLQIIINRLRHNTSKSMDNERNTHFVIIKSQMVEDVWLEFWSTTGEFGNNLPKGTSCTNTDFDKKSLKFLTSTTGGKDPPNQVERIAFFKNELLTRNRIVTKEDIKIACFAELGKELKNVEIAHKPIASTNRNIGFQNAIHVRLKFNKKKTIVERQNIVNHMAKTLEQKSSCIYKYFVEIGV